MKSIRFDGVLTRRAEARIAPARRRGEDAAFVRVELCTRRGGPPVEALWAIGKGHAGAQQAVRFAREVDVGSRVRVWCDDYRVEAGPMRLVLTEVSDIERLDLPPPRHEPATPEPETS